MHISDCSSDVCSSDLTVKGRQFATPKVLDDLKRRGRNRGRCDIAQEAGAYLVERHGALMLRQQCLGRLNARPLSRLLHIVPPRSEEHTSELQSLMRISYAVFCLKKKNRYTSITLKI